MISGGIDSSDAASFSRIRKLAGQIRLHALSMTSSGGAAHIGSVLSIADIVAVLYGAVLRLDPQNPAWSMRDRLLLSKGHAGVAIYAALSELGFFGRERLREYYTNGSVFSGHVSHKGIPGVEFSTGSLGHGLGVACGMAYAARTKGHDHRVFAILSDGECDEGSNWEAIHFAGHHELGRLRAVVDYNGIQSLKSTEETMGLEPFADKWRSFRWDVREVDGHDHRALCDALCGSYADRSAPVCVIARTTKGKGVSFMENSVLWHYRTARGEEFDAALVELEKGS